MLWQIYMRWLALSNLGAQDTSNSTAAEELEQLHKKLKILQDGIEQRAADLDKVDQLAAAFSKAVRGISQSSISRHLKELHSGGNIRLEDGKPSDYWCAAHSAFLTDSLASSARAVQ